MGSGYRTFTAGEVLTASNVQNFLQNQSVMVFADSTARATSIGTANFEEGMVSYLEDTDTVEVYDGSAWGSIAPATSQGLTLINTTSFSAVSSVSFPTNTFSSSYNTYLFTFDCTGSTAITIRARLRAAGTDNTSAQYAKTEWAGDGAPLVISANISQTSWDVVSLYDSDAKRAGIDFILTDVQVSGRYKSGIANFNVNLNSGNVYPIRRAFALNATTSYDSITFLTDTGNMTGSISCYGYNQ